MSNSNQNFISKDSALAGIALVGGVAVNALVQYLGGKTYDVLRSLYNKHYGSKKTLEEVAKELNISAKEASDLLEKLNVAVPSPDSYISKGQEEMLRQRFEGTVKTFYKPKKDVPENGSIYMVDTNVFIYRVDVINLLCNHNVVLVPEKVLDELDKLKISRDYKLKIKAMAALKVIRNAVKRGNAEIVPLHDLSNMPHDLDPKSPDNIILCCAIEYNAPNFILMTSDNGFAVKATGYGIKTQTLKDYCREHNIKQYNNFVIRQLKQTRQSEEVSDGK